jgi:hypothetical protein
MLPQPVAAIQEQKAFGVNAGSRPLPFCIVESGPAGFYMADRIFDSGLTRPSIKTLIGLFFLEVGSYTFSADTVKGDVCVDSL